MEVTVVVIALALVIINHITNKQIDDLRKRVTALESPEEQEKESDEVCG